MIYLPWYVDGTHMWLGAIYILAGKAVLQYV
jgi:hypothetical protein